MSPTTLSSTPRAMTPAEKLQIEQAAQGGISDAEKAQISKVLRQINPADLDQFDATIRASLDSIIQELKSNNPHGHDHGPRLSDSQYLEKAKYILGLNETTKGDEELYKFQMYFNMIHSDANDIDLDGASGPQIIEAITSHVKATQVFLIELGAKIDVDGNIGPKTKAAIKKYFGFDIVTGAATAAAEKVVEEIERIQNLTDAELFAALQEANGNLPEKLSDKRAYISEYVRRYKDAGYTVIPNSNNKYVLTDINNNAIATQLSQEDLQSIMALLAVNGDDIFKEDMLKENVANNIFDYVVKEHEMKSSTTGNVWQASDFEVSALRTQSEVDASKAECTAQIDVKITDLRAKNAQANTNKSQKQSNLLMIQKLEIAKIFVDDKTRISSDALTIAQSITGNRAEIARALGKSEKQMVELYNLMEGGDAQSLAKSMIFPMILALFAGIFSRLLPEGFLRKGFQGGILGLLGLKGVSEANKRGYNIGKNGKVDGKNAGNNGESAAAKSAREALNAILTDAPAGLETRHKTMYANTIKYNNEKGGITGTDSRKKLNTMFLSLSQDPTFREKSIDPDLKNLDAAGALALLGSTPNGVTGEEVKIFIRMLQDVSKDTQDKKAKDLFVSGLDSDEANLLNITWIAGDDFKVQNKAINAQILVLSGMSFGVDASLRGDSTRAKVEEVLGKAEPGFGAWITAGALEQVGMDDWNVTHPSITNMDTVITELTTVLGTVTAGSKDHAAITAIIAPYNEIKTSLEATQKVDTYLSEATAVYSIPGDVVRLGGNVVNWIKNFGNPVSVTGNVPATTDEIDLMITDGETLAANGAYAERKDSILTVVENLRLYRINRLDEVANDKDLTPAERDTARTKANGILKSTVEANLELYITTLESIRQDTVSLTQEHTNSTGYLAALSANKENLATLARFKNLGVAGTIDGVVNTFHTDADALYKLVFTNGIVQNFTAHVVTQVRNLNVFDTSAATLNTRTLVEEAEADFAKIQQELVMTGFRIDTLDFFGFVHADYNHTIGSDTGANIVLAMENMLSKVEGTPVVIPFTPNTLNTKKSEIDTRKREIIGKLEDEKIPEITVAGSPIAWAAIDVSNDVHITAAISAIQDHFTSLGGNSRDTLNGQIKELITAFVAKIPTANDQTASDDLDKLKALYDRFVGANNVGNASDERFNDALKTKAEAIIRFKMLNQTVADAPPKIQVPILELVAIIPNAYVEKQEVITLLNGGTAKLSEVFTKIDVIITREEGLESSGAGSSILVPLKAKKAEILSLLGNSYITQTANWIRSTFDNSESALRTFYNTLTR